jgi:vacuolar-type H+-ATPase subunit H
MFQNEQVKQWEAKVQQTIAEAQKVAQARARQVEAEARKAFELLGDRAQAEMKQFLAHAQEGTREQWAKFGGELIKLGQKLQEMAKAPAGTPTEEAAKAAVVDVQPPPDADVH